MEVCMTSWSPCNCCSCPEQCQSISGLYVSFSPASLCCICCSPSLENASDSLHILQTHFSLHPGILPQSFGLSSDLEVATLPWASKVLYFCFISKVLICLTPLIPILLPEAYTVADICHTLRVCGIAQVLTAQDRNRQFAFNWGEKHRTNAKVSVWTQRWQNRYSSALSLEKPCSMDLKLLNKR